jgi:hypothetical protein
MVFLVGGRLVEETLLAHVGDLGWNEQKERKKLRSLRAEPLYS